MAVGNTSDAPSVFSVSYGDDEVRELLVSVSINI